MVTIQMLDQLRAERRELNAEPSLTPDSAVTAEVHSQLDQQRERDIALHERAFRDARRHMRLDHALSRSQGQAKAIFNHRTQEIM